VTYVEEQPAKLVQVLIDDIWHDGTLEAWRRTDGRWRGYRPLVRRRRDATPRLGRSGPSPTGLGTADGPTDQRQIRTSGEVGVV
jgi:hypothetical protein